MIAIRVSVQTNTITSEDVLDIAKPEDVTFRWDVVDGESGAIVREGDGGYATALDAVTEGRRIATQNGWDD